MPVVPNTLERVAMLRLNRAPGPMLDVVAAGAFHAATVAHDRGVFAALTDGPRTGFDLARTLDADADALRSLLDFLVVTGYLERDGIYYENSSMTTRWLTDDGAGSDLGPYLTFWAEVVFPFWLATLDQVLDTGAPRETLYEALATDPHTAGVTHHGFLAVAELLLDAVLDAVDLPDGATRLLDVGGGHGRFAAGFLVRYPGLTATVVDRPEAERTANEVADRLGVAARLRFVAADYLVDDLGTDVDLALVSNVVHAHDPSENRRLFAHVYDALRPGGRVAVLDQFDGDVRTPAWTAALAFLDLNYHVTVGGQVHDAEEVVSWLADAGFESVSRESIGPGTVAFVAERE